MLYQKVIHYLAYVALILPALPPALFPFFQPYTFGKTTLFEIIVEAMAIAWLFAVLFRTWKPSFQVWLVWRFSLHPMRSHLVGVAVVALTAFVTLSTIFADNRLASFWGSSARMDGLFTLLHFFVFFIILASSFNVRAWRRGMFISVVAGTFAALYAVAQWFNAPFVVASGGEVFGTLGNPSYLALYLLFTIFFAHYLAQRELRHPSHDYGKAELLFARQSPPVGEDWINRETRREVAILLYCAVAIQVIALLLTQVQAAFLALAVGAVVAAYPYVRAHITFRRGITALTGVGVFIFLFSFSASFSKLASLSEGNASLSNRIAVWNIALSGVAKKPFIGHGANTFEPYYLAQKNKGAVPIPSTGETFDKPHNAFLEIAFSYGIIGLAAYLFLLWAILRRAWNTPALAGALTGYLVFLFFFFDTFASLLMFFFVAAFLARDHNEPSYLETRLPPTWKLGFQVGGTVVLILLFFVFHYQPLYSAYFARQFFIHTATTGITDEAVKVKALWYDTFNTLFLERAILLTERALKSR